MQEDKLKSILFELYALEPSLKEHETALIKLVKKMEEIRPDTRFDSAFAAELKSRVLAEVNRQKNPIRLFNLNFMNKKIYLAAGSLAVASLLFLALINLYGPEKQSVIGNLIKPASRGEAISKLPAGAFGSLNNLASTGSLGNNAESGLAAAPTRAIGMGGSSMTASETATFDSVTLGEADAKLMIEPGFGGDMMVMPPFYGFKYVYAGEDFEISEETAAVYRRLKGQGAVAQNLARTLSTFGFSEISLNTFRNLKVTNISFAEDSELGLFVNFDLNEDNIYIYENWEKWRWAEREACGGDAACWERYRLKINDVPADSEMIRISNEFLSKHRVSLDNYGEPQVDNSWRVYYDQTPDKANYYIPEYATVVYPLLINGEQVRDQSGGYAGLRVTINILRKAASGLSGLMPYRYEASDYALETDKEAILKVAENGGWNRNYYRESENMQTIELGTPERAYVQLWKYDEGRNDELLVPALIFPVINRPSSETYYYGANYVVVPLAKEMIAELGREPEVWPMWRGGVEPSLQVLDGSVSSPGAGATGSTGTSYDLEPMIEPEFRIMPIEPMLLKQ